MKIITHEVEGVWVRFPGTPQLDVRKIARLVVDGIWGEADLAAHGLRAAEPFEVPAGKVITGDEYFSDDGRQQIFDVEDAPEPEPERRMVPKWLIVARLTDEQLEAAIGAMTVRQQERWRAAAFPDIYADDPEMLEILDHVGADFGHVLREGEEI